MTVKYHYGKFPPNIKQDSLYELVAQTRTSLDRYDGFLHAMQSQATLLSPLLTQEAVLSSRIEGTQSTLTEVLEFEGQEGNNKKI